MNDGKIDYIYLMILVNTADCRYLPPILLYWNEHHSELITKQPSQALERKKRHFIHSDPTALTVLYACEFLFASIEVDCSL